VMSAIKIKRGDKVVVISGRDKGKSGEVVKSIPQEERVIVQGVNIVKRHQSPTTTTAGGILEKELSIHISNVAHVDPKDDKPTRVGFRFLDDGTKVRYTKRSGEILD